MRGCPVQNCSACICHALLAAVVHSGSPVSGLLNIRGALGGSASIPTGVLHIQLVDGALGRQKLARAVASLALNTEQRLACELELMPAESHGHIRLSGSVGLAGAQAQQTAPAAGTLSQGSQQQAASAVGRVGSSNKAAGSGGKKRRKHQQQPRQSDGLSPGSGAGTSVPTEPEVELALNVKDGGVALLTGLAPGLTWGGGSAAIELAAVGPAASPVITGTAAFSKGSLTTSFLKHPVSQLTGSLAVDGQQLVVSGLEAKVGSKGAVMLRGNLPLTSAPVAGNGSSSKARKSATAADGLTVGLSSIELRVRNMYSGIFDASVAISSSLSAPEICGELTFSKGTAYLVPPAAAGSTTVAAGAADTGASVAPSSRELGQAELVSTAFSALKAGRVRAALDHKHQVQQMVRHCGHDAVVQHAMYSLGQAYQRICCALCNNHHSLGSSQGSAAIPCSASKDMVPLCSVRCYCQPLVCVPPDHCAGVCVMPFRRIPAAALRPMLLKQLHTLGSKQHQERAPQPAPQSAVLAAMPLLALNHRCT